MYEEKGHLFILIGRLTGQTILQNFATLMSKGYFKKFFIDRVDEYQLENKHKKSNSSAKIYSSY